MAEDGLQKLYRRFYPWLTDGARDCSWESPGDVDGVPVSSDLDALGRELPDSTPMAPPVGYRNGPSLSEFVHRMIHMEISRAAAEAEYETFEEADDFDIPDDPLDPLTPYEEVFMPQVRTPPSGGDEPLQKGDGSPQGAPPAEERGGGGAKPPSDGQTGPVGSPSPASGASMPSPSLAHSPT